MRIVEHKLTKLKMGTQCLFGKSRGIKSFGISRDGWQNKISKDVK